jgi:hypothetical protein
MLIATEAYGQSAARTNPGKKHRKVRTSPPQRAPPAPAASDSASAPAVPGEAPVDSTRRHWYGSLLYSSADEVRYKGDVDLFGSPTPFTATEGSNPAFGLAGGYISRRRSGFGYGTGLMFEFVRKSEGIEGNAGGVVVTGNYVGSGGTNLWSTHLNGNYSFGSDFYLFLGVNYPLTFLSKGAEDFRGLPGYQVGAGYAFTDRISAEAGYRMLRLKGTIDHPSISLDVEEGRMPGFILSVQYLFH